MIEVVEVTLSVEDVEKRSGWAVEGRWGTCYPTSGDGILSLESYHLSVCA